MNTLPTLQVVVNPLLRRGSLIHDRAFAELRKLGAENVRYVPWFPYPRYAIAELEAPADKKTSWDFSLIEPFTIDIFSHLATLGIDAAGESQLVGYPSQFPSVSMVDWETGVPIARLRVLELLKQHFAPGDKIVSTNTGAPFPVPYYHAQVFKKADGKRKLLLISKRARSLDLALPNFAGATAEVVDQITGGSPARIEQLSRENFRLPGFAVAVLTLP